MFLIRPFIKLLSWLPMRVLYRISDALFLLVFHVFTYRRVTVERNLAMSFPDLPTRELRRIERDFYRHFCDLIVEGVKAFSITGKELDARVTVTGFDVVGRYIEQGKSICGIIGHLGNWEWTILRLGQSADFPVRALYQPTSNKRFDHWLRKSRERLGARLISTRDMRPLLKELSSVPVALGTLGDQTPVNVDRCHWMTFMRQPTPVYTGTEKLARNYDMAVFYIDVYKIGRGHYQVKFDLITDRPNDLEENTITEIHTRMLEESIRRQPEIWLWTHRRWKRGHLKPPDFK